jgi:hypothetical protein
MRVGLVTCVTLPEEDPDQEPLLAALHAAGVEAELLPWDDPQAAPESFDLCVIRSTWNYHEDPARFLAWIRRAEQKTRLHNPGDVVRWNAHKGYLRELEAQGVPIVPTAWIERGAAPSLLEIMERQSWDDVVIKPAVSAASYRTRRFRRSELPEAQRFLDDLVRDRDVMVQRYMSSTEEPGEHALVWVDGAFTHAVRRSPRFSGDDEEFLDAMEPTREELEFGRKVISLVDADLLYGRVDVILAEDGTLLLSELELLEPSLYLVQSPTALNRLVRAIVGELHGRRHVACHHDAGR